MPTVPPHTAKAIVFTCIDERLEPAIASLIHSLSGGAFHAAIAGGGGAFGSDPDRAVALKQVVAAYQINHITDVYLQSHMSCGAYSLAGITFDSATAEAERLYADLDAAAVAVRQDLTSAGAAPDKVSIHCQVIDLTGQPVERPGGSDTAASQV